MPIVEDELTLGACFRIKAILPTLNYLSEHGAKVIIISHFGKPKGRDMRFSLYPVFLKLGELWQKEKLFLVQKLLAKKPKIKYQI